jgi:probable rRNA maturation factor
MIYFQVSETLPSEGPSLGLDEAGLLRAAQETLIFEKVEGEADLTLLLTDDEQLRQLNSQYLGIDAPTDVLSFPAGDPDPDTEALYLGDVVISVPRAAEQARAGGHALEAELQLLVVHGVLHLLGHDHAEEAQKERMWQAQAGVLARLGLSGLHIPE